MTHNDPKSPYMTPNDPKYSQDQDISHIVDQVLSCIDQFENNNNDSQLLSQLSNGSAAGSAVATADFPTFRDGLETVLCHNCGALIEGTKKEHCYCRQCGAECNNSIIGVENASGPTLNSTDPDPHR